MSAKDKNNTSKKNIKKDVVISAKDLGHKILKEVQKNLDDLWDKIEENDKIAIQRASERLAELYLRKLNKEDVEGDLRVVLATLQNYLYVEEGRIYKAFWLSVDRIINYASRFMIDLVSLFL